MSQGANIALAGNPNTGKTSLFNRLTGSHQRVGNYPGVTVELARGDVVLPDGRRVEVLDIPGTYSLVGRSAEERLAVGALLGLDGVAPPSLAVFCVDATQLTRNLYLLLQAQELGLPCVVALTMVDEAGDTAPSSAALEAILGCPVVPCVPRTGEGIDQLLTRVGQALGEPDSGPCLRFVPSERLSHALATVREALPEGWPRSDGLSLWALMSVDPDEDGAGEVSPALREAVRAVLPDSATAYAVDDEIIQGRYAWLDAQVGPLLSSSAPARKLSERVDRVLIHPIFGFVIFLAIMFLLFQSLFAWADPIIGWLESILGALGGAVSQAVGSTLAGRFLVEGLIGGVGSVLVFLPQIILLFLLLGLLEDSGYMARVAYLMDRIMRTMGLHGRAFVPMLSGFACAVPAVMATRTMERQRDRTLTMMVVPLMTCSARLPVYTLLIGALFPVEARVAGVPVQGGLMVAMYVLSVVMALFAAFVLSKTVLPAPPNPLILELPPYRLPRLRDVARMVKQRAWAFLSEAGTVILACTMVLWVLLNFPQVDPAALSAQGLDEHAIQGEQLRESYAGQLGHWLEPALEPLGFDWKVGVGLVGAFAAREVFVSTMGVVYNVGESDEEGTGLRDRIRAEKRADGTPVYTPLMGLSLLVFFALACQCMSTLAVVKRETHGYRWPLFLFAYMTLMAWVSSLLVYQGGRLLGFS